MNYVEALEFITQTYKFGSKMGLERITMLLEILGNPHKKLKFVHIAGTNGKGSTTSLITNILMSAGYKTGMFVSPYIQRFGERIRINNVEISEEDIAEHIYKIKEAIGVLSAKGEPHPTEFEILTAMCFMHYAKYNCEIVVLETGLGGIIDSTNVIETSLVSVITTISFDHQQQLGDTIEEIAEKKAGIIKQNGTVVIYPQEDNVMAVFEKECQIKNAQLIKVFEKDIRVTDSNIEFQEFDYLTYKSLKIGLLGHHQILNASVSVRACEALMDKGYNITEENIRQGLLNTKWAGRFEIVHKNPIVIIDGAHNEQGASNLAENLSQYFPNKKITFVVGVLRDKDFSHMLLSVNPIAKNYYTVTPDYHRALEAEELKEHIDKIHGDVKSFSEIDEAMKYAVDHAEEDDVICAFGSLYYIGIVRTYFGLN